MMRSSRAILPRQTFGLKQGPERTVKGGSMVGLVVSIFFLRIVNIEIGTIQNRHSSINPFSKTCSFSDFPLVNKHRPWKSPIFNGN